ncbi:60S ribosomal subunit assembly/export protein LOC1 [Dendryphion nanum]|uniref:60S ribosomal subunit assembly/export protein LOC1 n=1 Tax=Dendryphion nanum TaxID=256645 RepID=A0A9P9DBX6_9PLEO|nr:60S ribosomal subunit assembly/export protein LOC1 [Dendryphion nanum]
MAPAPKKPAHKGGKSSSGGSSSKKPGARKPTGSAPTGISKRKQKSLSLAKPGGAQKTRSLHPSLSSANKRKKHKYTEAQLDIPKLNGIIPTGIAKPRGEKKGKKFVDDPESMMAIMSVVNAEKEGVVESKIMRARQLEEVREAKKKEEEKRKEEREKKFDDKKRSLKKGKRNSEPAVGREEGGEEKKKEGSKDKKFRKRVSFG